MASFPAEIIINSPSILDEIPTEPDSSVILCLSNRYPSEYNCMICLDDIEESNDLAKMCETNCLHHFHIDCLQTWKSYNMSCPSCKQYIYDEYPLRFRTEEQYVRIIHTLETEYSKFPSNHNVITVLRKELSDSIMKINNIENEQVFINFDDESTNDFADNICKYINLINSQNFVKTLNIQDCMKELLYLSNSEAFNGRILIHPIVLFCNIRLGDDLPYAKKILTINQLYRSRLNRRLQYLKIRLDLIMSNLF